MKWSMYESPCKNCGGHRADCHIGCRDYKKWRIINELRRRRENEITEVRKSILSPAYVSIHRNALLRKKEGRK